MYLKTTVELEVVVALNHPHLRAIGFGHHPSGVLEDFSGAAEDANPYLRDISGRRLRKKAVQLRRQHLYTASSAAHNTSAWIIYAVAVYVIVRAASP